RMDFDLLGAHLWDRPDWCPALRLSFEVIQLFFRDRRTRSTESDMNDFSRMLSVPYVDVFTADAAKRDYLRTLREGKQSRLRRCRSAVAWLAAPLHDRPRGTTCRRRVSYQADGPAPTRARSSPVAQGDRSPLVRRCSP